MAFPNRAGNLEDNDEVLTKELEAAGIKVHNLTINIPNMEVVTHVYGILHGWTFTRAWYYWVCKGPGIELKYAMRLHDTHGKVVRVDGHCGCPSPLEWYKGLACGNYHVDTAEGLKALADTIKEIVANAIIVIPDENNDSHLIEAANKVIKSLNK